MNRAHAASTSESLSPKVGMVPQGLRSSGARPALRVLLLVSIVLAFATQPIRLGEAVATSDAAHYIGQAAPVAKVDPRDYVRERASRSLGWTGQQWACLTELIRRESGWRVNAANRHSSARGLFQVLHQKPGLSLERQTTIGLRYIKHRHHTPCHALAFHTAHGWY